MYVDPIVTHIIKELGLYLDQINEKRDEFFFCNLGGEKYIIVKIYTRWDYEARLEPDPESKGTMRFGNVKQLKELLFGKQAK